MGGLSIFLFLVAVEAGISSTECFCIILFNVRFVSDVVEFACPPDDFIITYLLGMKACIIHLLKYNLEFLHASSIALMTNLEICQSIGTWSTAGSYSWW